MSNAQEGIVYLPMASLVPYVEHPFKLYDGNRFDDMIKSIKEMGIIVPIMVRPIGEDNKKYEILSGHNRVNAAKAAGLTEVPAIIKIGLSDDEAQLIVTETNLLQRSFADLSHSERAVALKTHMAEIKKQGKRNDLMNKVDDFIKGYDNTEIDSASRLLGSKSNTSDKKLGDKFNLSSRSIARYVRIAKLINPLLTMIDNKTIGIYPSVSLSYLTEDEQRKVFLILFEKQYKLDIRKAEKLRELSKNQELSNEQITVILSEVSEKSKSAILPPIKIRYHIYSKYFSAGTEQHEMEDIIDKALQKYFGKDYNEEE